MKLDFGYLLERTCNSSKRRLPAAWCWRASTCVRSVPWPTRWGRRQVLRRWRWWRRPACRKRPDWTSCTTGRCTPPNWPATEKSEWRIYVSCWGSSSFPAWPALLTFAAVVVAVGVVVALVPTLHRSISEGALLRLPTLDPKTNFNHFNHLIEFW